MFVTMAVIDRKGYSVLPWGDMWDYWILRSKANFLTTLAAQHNEHRIAVARLFFVVDQTFFQARSVFIFVSIFLIQLFHAVLLSCLACRARTNQRTTAVFLGSAAFVCLFSAQQYTNFTWGFQIQFVAVYFAVAGALAALMSLASLSAGTPMRPFQRRSFWLVMAIVTGVIATYSMANGLLVWPILLLAAFCLGVPWREKLVLLVAGVVVWTLYLWGYKTPVQHSSIGDGFHNLPQSFAFAMCVLGSPLDALVSAINKIFSIGGENWRLVWTAAGGLAGLITGAFLWGNFVRNRHEASRSEVVVLHILLFVIATVFLIGFGRTNFPLVEALQSRYTTPALLFWFCILFLFSLLIERNFTRRGDRSLLLLFQFASTAILVLVIVLHQPPQIRYARNAAVYLSEVEAAISAPVYDQEIWGRIYHNPKAMIPAVRYLQSNHLSVFALERVKWLGDPITAHYKMVDSGRCAGYFDEAEALGMGRAVKEDCKEHCVYRRAWPNHGFRLYRFRAT
jgi:hypothetical protein